MLKAGKGSIINVSSVHGSTGVSRMAAYGASKGGVENLTRSLAVEWADRSGPGELPGARLLPTPDDRGVPDELIR